MIDLPTPLIDPGLVDAAGVSVAYRDWAHLIQWPGDLLYGDGDAIATGNPATIAPPDWEYRRVNAGRNARQKTDGPTEVPSVGVRELRSQLGYERLTERTVRRDDDRATVPDSISRPNPAAAFGQAQRVQADNPVLKQMRLGALERVTPPMAKADHSPNLAGAQWALDWLATDAAGEPIIFADLLDGLGPFNGGKVLGTFLARNVGREDALRSHRWFLTHELPPIQDMVTRKQARLKAEVELWAEAGRVTVLDPAGQPDALLTEVGAATALVGLLRCAELGIWLEDWLNTVGDAIAGHELGLGQ